jgi:hypothetical protein
MGSMTFSDDNNYNTNYTLNIQPTIANPQGLNLNQFENIDNFVVIYQNYTFYNWLPIASCNDHDHIFPLFYKLFALPNFEFVVKIKKDKKLGTRLVKI